MPHAKDIVLALLAAGEAGDTPQLPQGTEPLSPAGQYLMRVSLMTDIPDYLVSRRIKDAVQGYGQFYYPQTGRQMATSLSDGGDYERTKLISQLG
jgi:hypothetical protein